METYRADEVIGSGYDAARTDDRTTYLSSDDVVMPDGDESHGSIERPTAEGLLLGSW